METKKRKRDLGVKGISTEKSQDLISHIAKEIEIKEKMRLRKMLLI